MVGSYCQKHVLFIFVSVSLLALGVFGSSPAVYCENMNDDSFFNRCRRERDPHILTSIASFVVQWVNPRQLAISVFAVVLFLPVLYFAGFGKPARMDLRKFHAMKIKLLHFLHRLTFSLSFNVALYAVFRQRRPCTCRPQDDHWAPYTPVGSRYGMPSGDAMAAGIAAAFLFEEAPFFPWAMRTTSVFLVFLVGLERTVLGYHSIGQVTVGSCLGILLHVYSTRAPMIAVFVDAAIQTILGAITLHTDDSLSYSRNDMNNLWAWFVWGLAFEAFCVMMIAFTYFRQRTRKGAGQFVHFDLRNSIQKVDVGEGDYDLANVDDASGSAQRHTEEYPLQTQFAPSRAAQWRDLIRPLDIPFTMVSLGVFSIISFISNIITVYNWMD
eukprot:TRINITY_DN5441_c0_g2_i1.p1 TRINITY_DN5441_c0_g2~~TRINITY_DN5441_c0_g2_i1.p1  ORF type:complete len:383 (+),score=60.08 TRINITY_DN5441_c0_g2_i1:84-1232(+)